MHKAAQTTSLIKKLVSTLAVLALGAGGVVFFAPQVNATGSVTITFDADTALGARALVDGSEVDSMPPQVIPQNQSTSLTANTYRRPGYAFGGWATSVNTSYASFAPGAIANEAQVSYAENTTLYARWLPNHSPAGSSDPVFYLDADMGSPGGIKLQIDGPGTGANLITLGEQSGLNAFGNYFTNFPIPTRPDQIIRLNVNIPSAHVVRVLAVDQLEATVPSGSSGTVSTTTARDFILSTSGQYDLKQLRVGSGNTEARLQLIPEPNPTNNVSTSLVLRTFNSVSPAPPSAPTNLTTTVTSATAVSLGWTPSTTNGVSHNISSNPSSGITCATSTASAGTCTGAFVQGQQYTFSVVASAGGANSSAATATATPNPSGSADPNQGAGSGGNGNGGASSPIPPAPTIDLSSLNTPGSGGGSSNGSGSSAALVAASAGQTFTLTGTGMNNVDQVNVGDRRAIITLKTATQLGFKLPKNLRAGVYDLSLYGSFGSKTEAKFFSVAKKKVTQTVAGFGGNSPEFNETVRLGVSRTLAKLGGGVTLVCDGSTSGVNVTKVARKLARDRAKAACAYAKKVNPSLTTKIRISPASAVGAQARNVKLVYRNY
jgi:hypothetical protein